MQIDNTQCVGTEPFDRYDYDVKLWMRELGEHLDLEKSATRCNTLQHSATLCTVDEEAG